MSSMRDMYPSNSKTTSPSPQEERKAKPVANGKVVTEKRGFSRLTEIFSLNDVKDVKHYAIYEVVIPSLKQGIWDILTNFLNPGRKGFNGSARSTITGNVSYNTIYDGASTTNNKSNPGVYKYTEIIFATKAEAQDVLSMMDDIIEKYGMVSVLDMCDAANVPCEPTDNNYGWKNLVTAKVTGTNGGYKIVLPKVVPLK